MEFLIISDHHINLAHNSSSHEIMHLARQKLLHFLQVVPLHIPDARWTVSLLAVDALVAFLEAWHALLAPDALAAAEILVRNNHAHVH